MNAFSQIDSALSAVAPAVQEFYLFCFFCLGYLVFRLDSVQNRLAWNAHAAAKEVDSIQTCAEDTFPVCPRYSMENMLSDFRRSHFQRLIDGWKQLEQVSTEALSMAVTALVAMGRPDEVGLFVAKAVASTPDLRSHLHVVVAAISTPEFEVAQQHTAAALRGLFLQARDLLDRRASEALLVALARANDEPHVSTLLRTFARVDAPASGDVLVQVVQGFVSCRNLDAVLGYIRHLLSLSTPVRGLNDLVTAATRLATDACGGDYPHLSALGEEVAIGHRVWEVLDMLEAASQPPNEAFVLLLDWAARQSPAAVDLAARVENKFRCATGNGRLPASVCNALVRLHAGPGGQQLKAFSYFEQLVERPAACGGLSEGSVVGMISACVEASNADLAEHILQWARQHGGCTLPMLSATVKVLTTARMPERVCTLSETVLEDDIELDDAVSGQLIKQAVQAGKCDLARDLFKRARNPDLQNCVSIIRACGQEGNVEEALELLWELRSRGEADTAAYNCALDACVCNGERSSADQVFRAMKEAGRVDVVSYNILLKPLLGDPNALRDIDALLQEMCRCGFKPTVASYNAVLGGALSMQDFGRAWRVVAEMDGPGGPGIDAYTISILFKGYKGKRHSMDANCFDRAMQLVKKHGVNMDEILVNGALEACMALRDQGRLTTLLGAVRQSGWALPRQCCMHTYSTLLKAYGQCQQLGMAWKLWECITSTKGLVPSEQLYGQMIDVFITNGRLEDALKLFGNMKETHGARIGSQGFAVAHAMVIKGFAQRKECARALQLYEEMKDCGVKVELVVLNTLINACSRVGDMGAAARIFCDMVGSDCVPDLITYSTLIKGYCVSGELEQAVELLALMRKKGIKPDAIVFNSLLDGCAKQSMPELCAKVVKDMEESGVALSNYSASILIKLYGRCHDLDAAFRVIDELPQKYDFRPNAAVYTCLMSTCIAHSRLDLAMELRTRMIKEGARLDEKTYSTLLRGALRGSCTESCLLLVSAALDEGGSELLDRELVQSALALIQRRRQWDAHGAGLLARLQQGGVHVRRPEAGSSPRSEGQQGCMGSPGHRRFTNDHAGAHAGARGMPSRGRRGGFASRVATA